MTDDTTRMEKLADDLSAVTIPSCKHMEREEYRDCVLQMLDDLEQLGRRDGCIAAAWALDALPSFQRELAEARKIIADAASALTNDGLAGVLAAQLMLLRAPATSDVKGEEPSASDTNGGGKHIESDTKLTPLTCQVAGKLQAALSPSPAAASGETAGCDNHQWKFTGRVLTSYPGLYVMRCTVCGNEYQMPEEEYRNFKPTSAPAAESQGNAQHHSEGAKIPEGGFGSSAAESEGGEKEIADSLNALRNVIGYRDEQVDRALRLLASLADQRDALSARLAACEERCRELEAGIVEANRSLLAMPFRSAKENATLEKLGSLLAPKAGGEDAVV